MLIPTEVPFLLPFIENNVFANVMIRLHTVSKILNIIGIVKSILVSVSERQINDSFNDTFHNGDINKHKAILTQK